MPNPPSHSPIGFQSHDHSGCVAEGLSAAEQLCATKGLRFTPVRRRVLEILLEEHQAIGAYEVLERLQAEGLGAQPPAAYRALDFLVSNGFAHRVERLNAFVACSHPQEDHIPAFLICRACSRVAESITLPARNDLEAAAQRSGFVIEQVLVEAEGLCQPCHAQAVSGDAGVPG